MFRYIFLLSVALAFLCGVSGVDRASVDVEAVPMAVPGGMIMAKETLDTEPVALSVGDDISEEEVLKSCKAIKEKNKSAKSGVYTIKPRRQAFKVHCDMDEDNGGWTHIATVANFDHDNWSNTPAWESNTVFGGVDKRDNRDWKGEAYSQLPAQEVLIYYNNHFLLRTDTSCLWGRSFQRHINALSWDCASSDHIGSYCWNKCKIARLVNRGDPSLVRGHNPKHLFIKAGEHFGGHDLNNNDHAYLSTEARANIHYVTGLGAYWCHGRTSCPNRWYDLSSHADTPHRAGGHHWYHIYVR